MVQDFTVSTLQLDDDGPRGGLVLEVRSPEAVKALADMIGETSPHVSATRVTLAPGPDGLRFLESFVANFREHQIEATGIYS